MSNWDDVTEPIGPAKAQAQTLDWADVTAPVAETTPTSWAIPVAQGLTFGLSDEMASGIQALIDKASGAPESYGSLFNKYQEAAKAEQEAYARERPVASTALEIGGALTGGLGAARAAIPALQGISRLGQAGAGMAGGAAGGAVAGFGTAEGGVSERLPEAATGAAIGAVAGPAMYGLARGAQAVGRGARGAVSRLTGIGQPGPGQVAEDQIMRAFALDEIAPDEAQRRLAQWQSMGGDPAALVDIGGENVRGLAQAYAGLPGPGRNITQQFVRERGEEQAERIGRDITRNLATGDFATTRVGLETMMQTQSKPLYEAAYSYGAVSSPGLKSVLSRIPSKAYQAARKMAQLEGRTLPAKLDPSQPYDVQDLDIVKRSLDDMVGSARSSGERNRARLLSNLTRDLRSSVDEIVPEYAQARAVYAGPAASAEALDLGRNYVTKTKQITPQDFKALDPGQQEFFRLGVAQGLQDAMDAAPDAADLVKRVFGSEQKRNRLAAVFGSPEEFQRFSDRMGLERQMAETWYWLNNRANSMSTPRAINLMLAGDAPESVVGALQELSRGNLGNAIRDAISGLWKRKDADPRVSEAVATALLRSDPSGVQSVLQGMDRRTAANALGLGISRARALGIATATGAQLGQMQTQQQGPPVSPALPIPAAGR